MADDHSIMQAGLCKLVEATCDVVGTVEDGRALVEAAGSLKSDVILLNISLLLVNQLDAARETTMSALDSSLLLLTMHPSPT